MSKIPIRSNLYYPKTDLNTHTKSVQSFRKKSPQQPLKNTQYHEYSDFSLKILEGLKEISQTISIVESLLIFFSQPLCWRAHWGIFFFLNLKS